MKRMTGGEKKRETYTRLRDDWCINRIRFFDFLFVSHDIQLRRQETKSDKIGKNQSNGLGFLSKEQASGHQWNFIFFTSFLNSYSKPWFADTITFIAKFNGEDNKCLRLCFDSNQFEVHFDVSLALMLITSPEMMKEKSCKKFYPWI